MPLYGWDDSYSVSIPQIDEQHKTLFSLINKLHDAMSTGQARQVMGSVLDELVQYTVKHFSAEEAMLLRHGYGELAQHKAIHEQFTARVKSLQKDLQSGKLVISIEVMDFLQKWLVGHIQGTDQKYATALRGAAIRL